MHLILMTGCGFARRVGLCLATLAALALGAGHVGAQDAQKEKEQLEARLKELERLRAEMVLQEQQARLKAIEAQKQGDARQLDEARIRLFEAQRQVELRPQIDQLDRSVFRQDGSAASSRKRLETLLKTEIDEVDRVCTLTEEQKQKLQLAGRGDLSRFFTRFEEIKHKAQPPAREDLAAMQAFQAAQQEAAGLRMALQIGFFRDESLLYKALKNTLTEDQLTRYAAADGERRTAKHRTNVETALTVLQRNNPLRGGQYREVLKLMMNETKPARQPSPYDQHRIMIQLGRVAEKKLKPLLDDDQWQRMNQILTQYLAMEPQLRQAGVLPPADE